MRNYVIALYIRLSVEDFKTESLSIPNQKLILREKAMSLPEWDDSEILEFIDNGHTGTNFERPAEEVTEMWYKERMAPEGVKVFNPAFDVTDHELIAGIVTEYGIARAPYTESLQEIFKKREQESGR